MKKLFLLMIPIVIVVAAFRIITSHEVTGKITDEFGTPVPGVSVTHKSKSVLSKTDGTYKISIADANGIIRFSKPGYSPERVEVGGRAIVDVVMGTSGVVSNEVVVVGYGSKRKINVTGSVSTVRGKTISRNEEAKVSRVYQFAPMTAADQAVRAPRESDAGIVDIDFNEKEVYNTEDYDAITENKFMLASGNPLSTFSIDVDAASYSNVRRMLQDGQLPPAGAVRIEEMVNYFKYEYSQPVNDQPFAIHTEIAQAPWNNKHKLVLIGLQGRKVPMEKLPASNLVFLIDVSGSMSGEGRLDLVKSSLKLLTDQLREKDKVSIVVYAGAAGMVLKPTTGDHKLTIRDAIDNLEAGGSTAGGEGLRLAYKAARENFVEGGNNRVILCTDGDFNVGESSDDAMERLIEKERTSGVFLTVLGYGMGNYKDNKMQKLADKGNGNHAYIDGISEASKVLVNEFGGTLFTIAKDVKLQVEFNPAKVRGYRLIGYENRMLAKEDFNDDLKDAGELGSGHTVTALYEIIPAGVASEFLDGISVDNLRYAKPAGTANAGTDEIMTVKFRYKDPAGSTSKLIEHPLMDQPVDFYSSSDNFRFASAVAAFGMLLRNSKYKSAATYEQVLSTAKKAKGADEEGYRAEFIRLVQDAQTLVSAASNKR